MTNSPAFWIGYIVLIFAFMYFIAIRPQQKEKNEAMGGVVNLKIFNFRLAIPAFQTKSITL